MTHDLWTDLNKTIFAYLANVTLASLVDKQRAKETAVVQDRRRVAAVQDGAAPAL
jgi:Rrf2 family iron-sulfur cluster assembly transcriptional regulator